MLKVNETAFESVIIPNVKDIKESSENIICRQETVGNKISYLQGCNLNQIQSLLENDFRQRKRRSLESVERESSNEFRVCSLRFPNQVINFRGTMRSVAAQWIFQDRQSSKLGLKVHYSPIQLLKELARWRNVCGLLIPVRRLQQTRDAATPVLTSSARLVFCVVGWGGDRQ